MQQRSYSTTAADNFAAREGSRGRSQHSDSRLPRLDAASEERMVYIRPPLDSSMENSMNNGMYPMEEVGFEVKSPHHAAHMPEEMNGSRRQGRSESVFSETSTEMSNSDSVRDVSPGGEGGGAWHDTTYICHHLCTLLCMLITVYSLPVFRSCYRTCSIIVQRFC